jgi:hypothetical protein
VCSFSNYSFHFVVDETAGRVEHTQFWPKRDGLLRKIAAAMNQRSWVDICKKYIDVLRRAQEQKRLINVARRECVVTQVLNHHLRYFADKPIIFYDQYYGHQNSSGHDNLNTGYQKFIPPKRRRKTDTA